MRHWDMKDLITNHESIEDLIEIWPFLSAPGSSRKIISHERFSKLKGKGNLDASFQEKELTCVDTHTTSAEPISIAVILLTVQLIFKSFKKCAN